MDTPPGPGRVFLGLTEIAGYYRGLRSGLAAHGVTADVITIFPHAFGYEPSDQGADVERMVAHVRRVFPTRPARRTPWSVVLEVYIRLRLLWWAAGRYDTFVFGFRNTFLGGWDLPLLRLLGKRVVCVFHGSDSRPAYIDPQNGEGLDGPAMVRWVRRRRRVVRRLERWSHEVVVGALTTQLHRRSTVNFQVIGAPTAPGSAPERQPPDGRPLRIVHAPSHLATKGTVAIREVVAELERSGVALDYVELAGVRNEAVLAALAGADVLVDQLYSDTFLGGLGAEAAAVGCPAVVAGYELDLLAELVPDDARPPGYYCRPEQLAQTLASVLADHAGRALTGAAAHHFVEREWSHEAVAGRFLRLLRAEVPAAWRIDPTRVAAVHGCGIDEPTARRWIGSAVGAAGPSGLGVDDKPLLRAAFLDFLAARDQARPPAADGRGS